MGNKSKRANWEYNVKNTGQNINVKKWSTLKAKGDVLSPEFMHQVERNLKAAKCPVKVGETVEVKSGGLLRRLLRVR